MATNGKSGDNRRHGAVRNRSQIKNPVNGLYIKRNRKTGRFMDVKTSGGRFKGVRREK
ncbi:MAG: hypothetical protein K9N46_01790 [Candidatus Marinimicrobia bacterium]|nr:hypothetical protein [Candidatus Neomarinimicrobiota bacterium]MCF7827791.1 hypothetical protein [Candidatus Neomarinimicrobiota bacterium]MCF7879454.1 hypothetical protein [Candidatus Neomarinimicrobiota bacterium]